MNIYVGNLSREVTEQELRQAFESFGSKTRAPPFHRLCAT